MSKELTDVNAGYKSSNTKSQIFVCMFISLLITSGVPSAETGIAFQLNNAVF